MSERKNIVIPAGFVLSVSLLAASFTALFLTNYYSRAYGQGLGQLYEKIIELQPEAETALLSALREYRFDSAYNRKVSEHDNIILQYGYSRSDFLQTAGKYSVFFVIIGFLTGATLFTATLIFWYKKDAERVKALTDYLEKINTGGSGVLLQTGEDNFSKLQDEIYKTVTALYQTRDEALKAKENFAENLYNIAHQIKTPITSISLSIQMMKEETISPHLEQIRQQLSRLTHLEEALLLLSRIDAGTLPLNRKAIDVFTVLTLAADNLQEMIINKGVFVDIPELGAAAINADQDWTMEAIMNLLKNCVEHTPPGGTVRCSYKQNPLYTQIRIWDDGAGFAKEDISHLFERFYRGKDAKSGGIGIGLTFSKAIIERQNGTVSAYNLPEGGACFEVCFYSH